MKKHRALPAMALWVAVLSLTPAYASASVPAAPAPSAADSLLPSLMGPLETVFWGKSGLMRGMGFPLTEESREKELSMRRTMLTLHQASGFATLAVMAATVVTGQLIVNGNGSLEDLKSGLAWTTVGFYSTTAALSLLTPPPAIRRKEFSTLTLHKALAVVHVTGMFVAPILGTFIEDDRSLVRYHEIVGYTTLAALAGAMFVVTF